MFLSEKRAPLKFIWISIAASVATISLKSAAYYLTGSVGLLSDAIESFINLAAGIMALIMLYISLSPADSKHPFGHNKAEYFSSVIEGILIMIAAIAIGITAIDRLKSPRAIEELGTGLLISAAASAINLIVGIILIKTGKKHRSIILEADGKHLLTDVWTTGGVLIALVMVKFTGWIILDPVIAVIVALNIVYTGIKLIIRSVSGLMDSSLPEHEQAEIRSILEKCCTDELKFHSLYTRMSASKSFIFLHLLLPGSWNITRAHEITKEIERRIKSIHEDSDVFIHIEPLDDPDSFDDYLA